MAVGNRVAKLYGKWADTKMTMLDWVQRTMNDLPPGEKAGDVKAMIDAVNSLGKLVGGTLPMGNQCDREDDQVDLEKAMKKLGNQFAKIGEAGKIDLSKVIEDKEDA